MESILRIRLLGSFSLEWQDAPVKEVHSARLHGLLACLLLNRGAPVSRRQIAFQFWPDSSEAQAFANLRTLLAHLRRVLPESERFVAVDGHTVQWKPQAPCALDVDVFESAISGGRLEEAVGAYRGDLLPDCYDDWVAPHRERLQQKYLRALEQLIQAREDARDYAGAIRYAQAHLQHDPVNEATCSRLMKLYALQGDRSAAVRVFHQCAAALKNELGVEPGPEIRGQFEQMVRLSSQPETDKDALDRIPLVGRVQEWQFLLRRWQAAAAGEPGMLLLMGESGVGKTRLLEELNEWARRQGFTTLYARCYATQGRLAYAPVVDWLRSPELHAVFDRLDAVWLMEIGRLLPEIAARFPHGAAVEPVKEAWQQRRLFDALTRAVFAAPQPMLLVMDDLQWADQETLAWLSYLVRFNPHAKLLVVGAARPEEPQVDRTLQDLRLELQREQRLAEFELHPLDQRDSRALVSAVGQEACSGEDAQRIFLESEGNPLFIVETVRSRKGMQQEEERHRIARTLDRGSRLPGKVEAVIGYRLSELNGPAQALAALASVNGRVFDIDLLFKAWKSSEDELIKGLDELMRRRIVREQGSRGYDFSHDKIREAVYSGLSQAHRRLLHRSLAQALESADAGEMASTNGAASGEIATHYQQAGLDRSALPYFLRAGEFSVDLYANHEAVRYLRSGLKIILASPPDRNASAIQAEVNFRLLNALGDILEKTGEHQDARDAYNLVFGYCPGLDPARVAQTRRKIGQTWLAHQAYDQALQGYDEAEQALEVIRRAAPPYYTGEGYAEWVNITNGRMWVYYYQGKTEQIQELAAQILPSIHSQGSPQQRADLYTCLAGMVMRRERYTGLEEAIRYHFLALEAAEETGNQAQIAIAYFNLGFSHLWESVLAAARDFFLKSQTLAEKTGDENALILSSTYLCVAYRRLGQVEAAREAVATALELATRGRRPMYVAMAKANQSWLCWRDADYRQARLLVEEALELWKHVPISYAFTWAAHWPALGSALVDGDLEAAVRHARGLLSPAIQPPPPALANLLEKALAFHDAADQDAARQHLRQAIALAGETGYL